MLCKHAAWTPQPDPVDAASTPRRTPCPPWPVANLLCPLPTDGPPGPAPGAPRPAGTPPGSTGLVVGRRPSSPCHPGRPAPDAGLGRAGAAAAQDEAVTRCPAAPLPARSYLFIYFGTGGVAGRAPLSPAPPFRDSPSRGHLCLIYTYLFPGWGVGGRWTQGVGPQPEGRGIPVLWSLSLAPQLLWARAGAYVIY